MLLKRLPKLVAEGGRVGIISFHSLEDRMVKKAFQEAEKQGTFKRVTRKPIVATEEESHNNPRSRSAKLRIAQRLSPKEQTDPIKPDATAPPPG